MTKFPYWFAGVRGHGPEVLGIPVVYSPFLATNNGSTLIVCKAGTMGYALTNDPDFEWHFYRLECQEQARRIVRDGLRKRLPWLKLGEA